MLGFVCTIEKIEFIGTDTCKPDDSEYVLNHEGIPLNYEGVKMYWSEDNE